VSDLAATIEHAIVEHDTNDYDMGPATLAIAIAEAVKRSIDYEAAKRCETCKGTGDGFEEIPPPPDDNSDILDYVAPLFDLDDTAVPTDAIVILGFLDEQSDDPADSGAFWRYRVGGEGVSTTLIGLLHMLSHLLCSNAADLTAQLNRDDT
jgi:hypothetical protein